MGLKSLQYLPWEEKRQATEGAEKEGNVRGGDGASQPGKFLEPGEMMLGTACPTGLFFGSQAF